MVGVLDKRVTRILKSGCYIPLGIEDFVSIVFFEKAMARQKPQPYRG
jgi:hypothetical protein